MSNVSAFAISPSVQNLATTPVIVNVTCTLASTEYSYILPTGTKGFMIAARASSLLLSYVSGMSGTNYVTIPRGTFRSSGEIGLTAPVTLYFQAPNAGTIVEIEYWI